MIKTMTDDTKIINQGGKVRQFCNFCKKELEMIVVSKIKDECLIWCKCQDCNGIAPYNLPEWEKITP